MSEQCEFCKGYEHILKDNTALLVKARDATVQNVDRIDADSFSGSITLEDIDE